MSKTLVICEKNIAARRIAYFLSNGKAKSIRVGKTPVYEFMKDNIPWEIVGLRGHIITVDYPAGYNKWTDISPLELIDIEPCKKVSEKDIATTLKSLINNEPTIIVATDFDREGELIGVEAVNILKESKKDINIIKRAKFSAITNQEIITAFNNLTGVDYNLSRAGEARQIIDLVWGAVLTRFISLTSQRFGKEFLSIGRVQSPTLALIVDRENEIKNFIPKEFWKIIATLHKEKTFTATHCKGQIWDEKQANTIFNKVKNSKSATVIVAKKSVNKEYPPSPFSTTTFLQSASSLGFSTAKAMSIAEELYMSGLISYPRTDNTVYPSSLNVKRILEKLTKSRFSKEAQEVLTNGRKYPTRGKKQTTDHPPIHPVESPSKNLSNDQQKIYELICRRFLATLAKDAISETSDVLLDISGEQFKASGYRLIEPNWRVIYRYIKEKRKELPNLEKGDIANMKKINLINDKTKPPKRYTQGLLIAKMEQLSLGTKSTRHEIINKLYRRKYISGSPLVPTSTAHAVIDALSDCDVIKPKMTASLENDMSAIATGKQTLEETVRDSRHMLSQVMKSLEKEKDKIKTSIQKAHKVQNTVGQCPQCGKDMIIRTSRNSKRFVGCSGYPDCKNTYSLPQKGSVAITNKICSKCGAPIVQVKMSGKRPWFLCINSNCPKKRT
jgi:DNA topoisomerase-1